MKTDLEIKQDVIEELKWEPFLNASQIGVSVKEGVVTLSGRIDSYSKKIAAEKATKNVSGVKAVALDLEVNLPGSSIRNDTDIAEAVVNALKWHSAVRENKINVKVESGVVTLEGIVDWEFQKNSARMMVENLMGVKGIVNTIQIKQKTSIEDIKQKVSAAFHRSATIDASGIDIEIIDNKAILKGNVRSWAEKEDAENAVWSANGIERVDNRLEIKTDELVF
jgi:osmotically-inducible protein OsmY